MVPMRRVEQKGICLVKKRHHGRQNDIMTLYEYLLGRMCGMCVMRVGELLESCPVANSSPLFATHICGYTQPTHCYNILGTTG